MVRAVFFDVGETLVDETRLWASWADWLGVPHLTMFAMLGAVIERGEDHRRVFEILRPGIDLDTEQRRREEAGVAVRIEAADFYPDAIPCLRALRHGGYQIGLAGNFSGSAEESLRHLDIPVDHVGGPSSFGVEKPDPGFFTAIADLAACDPAQIAYVGDRIDNDVIPAADAGMHAIWIRRGPWAALQHESFGVARAHGVIDSLDTLPQLLKGSRWPAC